jgi:hypothetical protein
MSNLLLKLLDQWIDSIALPPESRGRFSAQPGRSATSTVAAPARAEQPPSAVERPGVLSESPRVASEGPDSPVDAPRPLVPEAPAISAESLLPVDEAVLPLPAQMKAAVLESGPLPVSDILPASVSPVGKDVQELALHVPEPDSTDDILSAFNWD